MNENKNKQEMSNREFMLKYAKYNKFKESIVKEMEENMSEIRAGIFIDFLISDGEITDEVCSRILGGEI